MLFYQTIDRKTLELLKTLQNLSVFSGFRLVGGTGLALQLGHRKSVDLDIFGKTDADRFTITNSLRTVGEVQKIQTTENINIFIINGIKVDIVNYPYEWLCPPIIQDGLMLADIPDIAAMKLSAITNRGTKKDFIDIFFLLKKYSLINLLALYKQKYTDGSEFLVLKSLAYFDDADEDPSPVMFSKIPWHKIKETIKTEVKRLNE